MKEFWEKVYKTLAFYQARVLRGARAIRFDLIEPTVERPVFVVGCSRAGTTLVYKTLSEAATLGSLQKETHDFWAGLHPPAERDWESHVIPAEAACAEDRREVAKLFYCRTGKRRFVDKNNQNGLSVPYLHRLFPDAFFVYVKRNPGDNIHSLMEGWRRAETFATWSQDLPAQVRIDGGRFRRWCFFLPPGWRDYLDAPLEQVCAFQYREMNAAILAAKEQVAPERWHEVAYETILERPVETFAEMFDRCQVPFDRHLEAHCRSVLQRPYNAFSQVGKDKWKTGGNRERIERVLPQVRQVAERMGYAWGG